MNLIADLLKQNGIGPNDRVAIYAKNSPLWLFGDLATMLIDAVSAPLYDTLSLEQIVYCLNLVGAKAIYCSQAYLPSIIASVDKVPSLRLIISFDRLDVDVIRTQTAKILM